tara:strand:- start:12 stop:530 length:519 start_codon:yes stop_codon:yes gene_type:complete
MPTAMETFNKSNLKSRIPDVQPGDTIRVHQKIKEGDKERIQVFEGVVLARKHGTGINATITVRKVSQGVAVERVFPIHAPMIEKIEIAKRSKVRRAKLYYLRTAKGRKARLRARAFNLELPEEEPQSVPEESPTEEVKEESTEAPVEEEVKEEETPVEESPEPTTKEESKKE